MTKTALIVGTGSGISASFARVLAREGYQIALTARNTDKLAALAEETKAKGPQLRRDKNGSGRRRLHGTRPLVRPP